MAFIGGEAPEIRLRRKLANGSDLIAAADSGLMAAEEAGLRPDWIVGDMDSLDDPQRLLAYPPERIVTHQRDKDYTDTELVLDLLWGKGCVETILVGGGGGRMDHALGIIALFERERFPDRWYTAREEIRCLREGESFREHNSRGLGRLISLFPLGDGPWEAESQGLKWPLAGLPWRRGFVGISNQVAGAYLSISAIQGRFLIIVQMD